MLDAARRRVSYRSRSARYGIVTDISADPLEPALSLSWPTSRWPTTGGAQGFDLAGRRRTPAKAHRLSIALRNNANVTVHAGRRSA
jgi:hypothetical protein